MTRPNKSTALGCLPKDRLLLTCKEFGLRATRNNSKAALVQQLVRSKTATYQEIVWKLTVTDLRTVARAHNLPSTGTKTDLIARIIGSQPRKANGTQRPKKTNGPTVSIRSNSSSDSDTHNNARPPRQEVGDARDLSFLGLTPQSIDLIVTSPPYWRRRDYGHKRQLGQEGSPHEYVEALVAALNGWSTLLRPRASVFLNLGDTYRNGFLVGIPALFEACAHRYGWRTLNRIAWTKTIGLPEPRPYRLANRHETIFHLTRAKRAKDIYFDLYALAQDLGQTANPGDAWQMAWPDDVWRLHPARSRSEHLAPFPPDLVRRTVLLGCPERVCTKCGLPHRRKLAHSTDLDLSRPQAKRAMELAAEHGLTKDHFAAIRAVGISDAGKGKRLQRGAGLNASHVKLLADEAKEALGGYFREFTFAPKRHVGWIKCGCNAPTEPGTVLDPFMGSGTTLIVAEELGRNALGVDLVVDRNLKTVH